MTKVDLILLCKGIFLGGLGSVGSLASILALVYLSRYDPLDMGLIFITVFALAICLMLSLWATGFWKHWGMLLFFLICPIALVVDYSFNPLFPMGVIGFSALCYAFKPTKIKHL
ncbi:hypothetical protein [Glaciecola sp. SC05]|uniref:hypothetical protein n=1 Tax=Glaciecola sp. SC05 TaxID=1987355 RepID=UPI00352964E4